MAKSLYGKSTELIKKFEISNEIKFSESQFNEMTSIAARHSLDNALCIPTDDDFEIDMNAESWMDWAKSSMACMHQFDVSDPKPCPRSWC